MFMTYTIDSLGSKKSFSLGFLLLSLIVSAINTYAFKGIYFLVISEILMLGFYLYITKGQIYDESCKDICLERKLVVLAFLISAFLIRLIITIKTRYFDKNLPVISMEKHFYYLFIFLIIGPFEEILIKNVLYTKLLKNKFNIVLNVFICSLFFSLLHFNFSKELIETFIYQCLTMFLYICYPNIYLFCIYHVLINLSMFI